MKRLALFAGAAALSITGSAFSATATGTMPVAAVVLNVCAVAALPLSFGNYNPTSSSNTDATSTVTVTCSLNTGYNVRMDPGSHGSNVASRKMLISGGGTDLLSYSLFRDSNRTQNWGQTDNTDTVSGTGTGLPQLITVYGRIPGSENVNAGAFADLVTVTVSY